MILLTMAILQDNIFKYTFWKDENSHYLGCDQNYSKIIGVNSKDIVGLTDFEIHNEIRKDKKIALSSNIWVENDKKVISSKNTLYVLEPFWVDNVYTISGEKHPIISGTGKAIGSIGIFSFIKQDLSSTFILSNLLVKPEKYLMQNILKNKKYKFLIEGTDVYLTGKEMLCILLSLRHNTASEVAHLTGVSTKTVEARLSKIREKFKAKAKAILFSKILSVNLVQSV